MSRNNQPKQSDEFIESGDKLRQAAEDEAAEAAAAALASWVEEQKALQAAAWQDTTQAVPLWKK